MAPNKLNKIISKAKQSSSGLLKLTSKDRRTILLRLSKLILENNEIIISQNHKDVLEAKNSGASESFVERLELNKTKINSIGNAVVEVANHKDELFKIIESKKQPSGIIIQKKRFPLGLIAMIYESRPNVTIDAFTMAFKSGNAIILKGGKEIKHTNRILILIIKKVLKEFSINQDIIQDVSGISREESLLLISNEKIDCLIPRGGKNLIEFVKNNAKIPVIITGASVVHTYIDSSADLKMAVNVITNAKTRRVSICNALDVLIIHEKIYKKFLSLVLKKLNDKNVEIRADSKSFTFIKKQGYKKLKKAGLADFDTEFLDFILAIKVVKNFQDALCHIESHSLGHSEAIITKSKKQAEIFFQDIDAACLYLNTSTQFSDGGEFGLGGEIGISTQKLHARGPFAYQELTTYKYIVKSHGATRK